MTEKFPDLMTETGLQEWLETTGLPELPKALEWYVDVGEYLDSDLDDHVEDDELCAE